MKDLTEFDLGESRYQIETMDAQTGVLVLKKIGPLVSPILKMFRAGIGTMAEGENATGVAKASVDTFFENAEEISTAFAHMPDDDVNYIFAACLRCVSRRGNAGVGWQKVWNTGAGALQFADLRPLDLFNIVGKVIKDQIVPF